MSNLSQLGRNRDAYRHIVVNMQWIKTNIDGPAHGQCFNPDTRLISLRKGPDFLSR
jgi:hypothetical protein